MEQWNTKVWRAVKDYYLELILGLLSAVPLFIDAGIVVVNSYFVLTIGLLFVALSTFQKIKGDRSISEVVEGVTNQFQRALDARDEKEKVLHGALNLLEKKQEESDARSRQLEEQTELIARLVKEGLISEKNIYEMLQKHKVFYLFCYQNVQEQNEVQDAIGEQVRNPSLQAIDRLGFVRVGTKHNFYVLPYDMLPASFRDPVELERTLKQFVEEEWENFLRHIEAKNKAFYDEYIKRHPEPTNCSYVIVSSNIHEATIDHIGYNTFSRQFKDLLHNKININKLKREIKRKKHSIQKFVKSISGELLLVGIAAKKDRDLILKNEEQIKKNLGVSRFTEYGGFEEELEGELKKYFGPAKAKGYAKHMAEKSRKYEELLSLLGINLE